MANTTVLYARPPDDVQIYCAEVKSPFWHVLSFAFDFLQAMDSSHVSLVALLLRKDGFAEYRADRNISLGLNLGSVSKILKCAANDDSVTVRADDDGDAATFVFEGKDGDRVSEFELKLMDIDSEHLGIPETGKFPILISGI